MTNDQIISERLGGSIAAIESLRGQSREIGEIADAVVECLMRGGTIYTCGNGGSAAEAMHLAEELIGRYRSDRAPLRAVCLNADPTALTCIANDFGFEEVFARQVEALVTNRDVLIIFSTSGDSPNIVKAVKVARVRSAMIIGLLGRSGGACRALCEHAVIVHSGDAGHVQEAHQVVMHMLCEAVEVSAARRPDR